jgi:hypothetical protein
MIKREIALFVYFVLNIWFNQHEGRKINHELEWETISHPFVQHDESSDQNFNKIQNLSYLANLLGDLTYTYKSNTSSFTYYDTSLVKIDFPDFEPTYQTVNISSQTVLQLNQETNQNSSKYYYYYSGNVMRDEFSKILAELKFIGLEKYVKGRKAIASLWMGSKHVRATTHYDSVYNVYLHLVGVKRFKLIAPRYLKDMYMHGRYHPHAYQSRVRDVSRREVTLSSYHILRTCQLDKTVAENSLVKEETIPVVEFDLKPGDVLFVPPFWMHEVHIISLYLYFYIYVL